MLTAFAKYRFAIPYIALCAFFIGTVPQVTYADTVVLFITSGTTWVVPPDFAPPWTIEAIGAGAGGGVSGTGGRGGGGGGAYAKITNSDLTLIVGSTTFIQIGAGGGVGANGTDTWLNKFVNAAATSSTVNGVLAKAGTSTALTTAGGGGSASMSVGSTKFSGGNGGVGGGATERHAGGGGTGGPGGVGGAGGAGSTANFVKGGGGGGATHAGAGSNGSQGGAVNGGNGGNNGSGAGAGLGAITGEEAATAGTVGGGGGGGAQSSFLDGAAGGAGAIWTSSLAVSSGPGGGGGGGNVAGSGGLYGGGGGSSVLGRLGANGIIVITYTAISTLTITTSSTVTGSASVIGLISKGSGTFVIDHPLDPKNKLLYHSFVESSDVKNIYDGIVKLDARGKATIKLPGYFLALNKDFRYLATPIGSPMPDLYLSKGVRKYFFGLIGAPILSISGGVPGGKVSWQVTGIRHDPFILAYPIIPEVEKGAGQFIEKGKYVCPECYSE